VNVIQELNENINCIDFIHFMQAGDINEVVDSFVTGSNLCLKFLNFSGIEG
jgi:hypothetical protein